MKERQALELHIPRAAYSYLALSLCARGKGGAKACTHLVRSPEKMEKRGIQRKELKARSYKPVVICSDETSVEDYTKPVWHVDGYNIQYPPWERRRSDCDCCCKPASLLRVIGSCSFTASVLKMSPETDKNH
ncbi:hypothetical protein R1flu_017322 [Riccia fluitans]|uniref:Uncharacterized protein n=1 Tax=Riccia fluitans TaxID=41844 RepID=A0ABD1ZG12_9MARC